MRQDISDVLRDWDYDPEGNVRTIEGSDGVKKLQVRVDQGAFQGILQLNLDGRPDGQQPHGHDFALDYYRERLQEEGSAFSLDRAACRELFDESARIYGRYVFLLQLKDYGRVIRDTERNMTLFRLVNTYAEDEEDRLNLEKWWPYILRINATARCHEATGREDYETALAIIGQARDKIEALKGVDAEEFLVERERSREALDELEKEISGQQPLSEEETLERQLQEAIEEDAFEEAARIRDRLNDLRDERDA